MNKNQELALKKKLLALAQSDQLIEAEKLALYLVEHLATDLEAWYALAQVQRALGKDELALQSFERVVIRKSDLRVQALASMIPLCIKLDLLDKGVSAAKKQVKIEPKSALAHYQLARMLWKLKHLHQAAEHIKKAIFFDPSNAGYHLLWAEVLAFTGDLNGALAQFEHTKLLDKNNDKIHLKRLMFQNYGDEQPHEEVFKCHLEFGKRLEARYTQLESFPAKNMTRKIRVAYVSTDFMRHSVSYFFLPLAKGYDSNHFELYCYSDMPASNADQVTAQLKACSTVWREVDTLTNEQLYTQIRHDEIDILVDLAGYAGSKSRMAVFARKAAPIQVTYLAYPNTTGLTRMDYRIVDAFTDPIGSAEAQSSEKLVRLRHSFLCFEPETASPSIEDLPADKADIFTFGSFNNYLKITDSIIDAWAKILIQVPSSRLYVKASVFADRGLQNDFVRRCKAAGIERKRLLLSDQIIDTQSHLAKYNQVDLHLDTYPYNGTTTTLEAMWMGVPTVTWAGGSHRSRVGNSIMSNLGLADYVAQTKEQYIDLAVSKANNLDALRAVRAGSRTRVSESAIMDNKGFVKELEEFYTRSMKELVSKGES